MQGNYRYYLYEGVLVAVLIDEDDTFSCQEWDGANWLERPFTADILRHGKEFCKNELDEYMRQFGAAGAKKSAAHHAGLWLKVAIIAALFLAFIISGMRLFGN